MADTYLIGILKRELKHDLTYRRETARKKILLCHPVPRYERTAMEKRHAYRQTVAFQVNVSAMVAPGITASGETLDISEAGIGVCLPIQLTLGSLVRLEIADSVLHGFVAYSREWSPMSQPSFARNKSWVDSWTGGSESSASANQSLGRLFRTGIEVVEVSIGASGLSQLLKADVEERMPHLPMTFAGAPGPEVLSPSR
jgi:hypothetical protein